jgi:hypothetical protein
MSRISEVCCSSAQHIEVEQQIIEESEKAK